MLYVLWLLLLLVLALLLIEANTFHLVVTALLDNECLPDVAWTLKLDNNYCVQHG